MKQIVYIILISLIPVLKLSAQKPDNRIQIENKSISRSEDNRLTIAMDIIIQPEMKVSSNRSATLTPLLKSNGNTKALPQIVVYGRRRALVNERGNTVPKDAYTIIRRKRNKEQRINYLVQLPFAAWMQRADLLLDTELCGCGNYTEEQTTNSIYKLDIAPDKPCPHIAYITPKAEPVKHRSAVGKAYLDFPVNQTIIYPDYRSNSLELAKIRATIDTVRNDKNTQITGISIEGFASPEGSYTNNARLAEGRAQALLNYVRNFYQFDNDLLSLKSTPEDWDGVRQFIENSQMENKNEILHVIDNNELNYDIKEKSIIKLIGSENYRFLLNECYPALRRSDYKVNYTVRGFTLEESKEIIKKRPQQLSLQEIFNVAQSYEKGSDDFNHAFQVAVLMFPEDQTANLNAAAMEIQKEGDLSNAKRYLSKANPNDPATLNNWAVIALIEGDLDRAEIYLQKAREYNIPEADLNLKEVAKQRNFPVD